jgi:hypothetical protein
VNDFGTERFTWGTAQALHAVSPEIGDPDIDLTLRYVESRRDLGAGPLVDKDALDDQRSSRQRN